jgi:protein-tyrosine phosphatase
VLEVLSGFANFRPVGGAELQEDRSLLVFRSSTPEALSVSDRRAAEALFDRVIDLRTDDELTRFPHPLADTGAYRHRPMLDPARQATDARLPAGLLAIYCDWSTRHCHTLRTVFDEIASLTQGTVLIGCAAGKDRTGVASALLARLRGASDSTLGHDYALTAERMADRFRRERTQSSDPKLTLEMQRCEPETIITFIHHVESTYGSINGYLEWLGLDPPTINRLTAQAHHAS